MTTFGDVGATLAQLFWGNQLGTYGFAGSATTAETAWTVELKAMRWESESAFPSFTDIDDVDFITCSVVDELAGTGSAEVVTETRKLASGTVARLRDIARNPTEMWVWRGGQVVFAGPIVGHGGDGGTITITATGLLSYLGWMARHDAYVKGVSDAYDQTTIVKDLIDGYQSLEYGHFGLDTTPLTPSGVTQTIQLLPYSAQTFDRLLPELGAREEGFELWANPATRGVYAFHPRRGQDLSQSVIIDERQVVSTSWRASAAPGQFATDIVATAQAPGGGGVVSRAGDAALRAIAGRRTLPISVSDVTSKAELDSRASQAVADYGTQVLSISQGLVPIDMPFGTVGAGDLVAVDLDFGLGAINATRRVSRVSASVSSGGERLAVEFV